MLALLVFLLLFQLSHLFGCFLIKTGNQVSVHVLAIEAKVTRRGLNGQAIGSEGISLARVHDVVFGRGVSLSPSIILAPHDPLDFFDLILIKIYLDLVDIHLVLARTVTHPGSVKFLGLLSVARVNTRQRIQIRDVLDVGEVNQLVHLVA